MCVWFVTLVTSSSSQVKNDKHYVSDIAYGGSGTGHIWAQPKNEESSAFYLDANFEKAFKIDDISSVFHYELINKNGNKTQVIVAFHLLRIEEFD